MSKHYTATLSQCEREQNFIIILKTNSSVLQFQPTKSVSVFYFLQWFMKMN